METNNSHNVLFAALQELNEKNILVRGDVIQTEQDFKTRVIINDQTPTISWAVVQAKMDELRPVEALKKLREQRDPLLDKTDRFALPDFPHDSDEIRQAWLNYRQELRDLPANSPNVSIDLETGELTGVVWPTEPTTIE